MPIGITEAETHALEGTHNSESESVLPGDTWLHQVAGEVVRFCHLWAGSEIVKKDSPSADSRATWLSPRTRRRRSITLVAGAPHHG